MNVILEDSFDGDQSGFADSSDHSMSLSSSSPFLYSVPTQLNDYGTTPPIKIQKASEGSFAVESFCADTLSRSISELNIALPGSLGRSYEHDELPFLSAEDSDK
jgi:hypothetical protein